MSLCLDDSLGGRIEIDDIFGNQADDLFGGLLDEQSQSFNRGSCSEEKSEERARDVSDKISIAQQPAQFSFLANREEVNSFENLIKSSSSNPPKYQYNPGHLAKRTKALLSIHTLELIEKNFPEVKHLKPAIKFLEKLAAESSSKICQKVVDKPKEHMDISESEKQGYIRIFPAFSRLDSRLNKLAKTRSSLQIMNSKPESLFTDILYQVGAKCRVTTEVVLAQLHSPPQNQDYYKVTAARVSEQGEDPLFEAVIPKKADYLTVVFILALREVSGRLYWNIKREIAVKYLNFVKTYESVVKIYKPAKTDCLKSLQAELGGRKQDDSNNDQSANSRAREKQLAEVLVDPPHMLTMTISQLKAGIRDYMTQFSACSVILLDSLTRKSDSFYFEKDTTPLVISLSICMQRIYHKDIFILRYRAEQEGFSSAVCAFGKAPQTVHHPEFAGLLFQEGCAILSTLPPHFTLETLLANIEGLSKFTRIQANPGDAGKKTQAPLDKRGTDSLTGLSSSSKKELKVDRLSSSSFSRIPEKLTPEVSPKRVNNIQEEITVNYKKLTNIKQLAVKTCSFKQRITQMKSKQAIDETIIESTSSQEEPETIELLPEERKPALAHAIKAACSNPRAAFKSAKVSPEPRIPNRSKAPTPTPDLSVEENKTHLLTETITSEEVSSMGVNPRGVSSTTSIIEDEPPEPPIVEKKVGALVGSMRRTEKYFQMLDSMFQRK